MDISLQDSKGVLVARLDGRLDITHSATFEKRVIDALTENPRDVVINLAHVSYMSSSGISSLLGIFRFASSKGRKMMICDVSPAVIKLLEVVELSQVFRTAPHESEAVAELARSRA